MGSHEDGAARSGTVGASCGDRGAGGGGGGRVDVRVEPSETPGLLAVVTGVTTLPVGAALGWAVLVDRTSITGAVERPEESVESRWLEQAAFGALFDGFAMIGLGAGAIAITGVEVAADVVLIALWVLLTVDVGVRYLVARRTA
jgi:hypothetical protein